MDNNVARTHRDCAMTERGRWRNNIIPERRRGTGRRAGENEAVAAAAVSRLEDASLDRPENIII